MIPENMLLTQVSYVELWDCDANMHLNVQHYTDRFDTAHQALFALRGAVAPALSTMHIRYHRELRTDAAQRIFSGVIADGDHAGRIVHLMENAQTGVLSATALQEGPAPEGTPAVAAADIAPALPRGLPLRAYPAVSGDEALAQNGVVSVLDKVPAHLCDGTGAITPRGCIDATSDGAVFLWAHLGVSSDWLAEHKAGRTVVESVLTMQGTARMGDIIRCVHWVREVGSKTVSVSAQIETLDGRPVARNDVTALIMDLEARKAMPVPQPVRDALGL